MSPCSLYELPPWKHPNITSLHSFKGYDKIKLAHAVFQKLFAAYQANFNGYTDIYTDGSKCEDIVGCGTFCENTSLSYLTSLFYFSVYSCIERALLYTYHHYNTSFIIYQIVLLTLSSRFKSILLSHPSKNFIMNWLDVTIIFGFCWV